MCHLCSTATRRPHLQFENAPAICRNALVICPSMLTEDGSLRVVQECALDWRLSLALALALALSLSPPLFLSLSLSLLFNLSLSLSLSLPRGQRKGSMWTVWDSKWPCQVSPPNSFVHALEGSVEKHFGGAQCINCMSTPFHPQSLLLLYHSRA